MRSMSSVSRCRSSLCCLQLASGSIVIARCGSAPLLRLRLRLISRKTDQLGREIRILARANAEHQRAFAVPGDIGMPHGAVDVDALPRGEPHRTVELQVHFDGAFDDKNEFFTFMLQGFAKL